MIAEALKPEDRAMIGTDTPTVIVLNKADLGVGNPAGRWRRRIAAPPR